MSTAGISSSSLIQGAEYFQDRRSDLQQLGQALQAGNLAGAQQDRQDGHCQPRADRRQGS